RSGRRSVSLTRRTATFGGNDGGWNARRCIARGGRSVVGNEPLRVRDRRDRGDKRDHSEAHRSSPLVGDPLQSALGGAWAGNDQVGTQQNHLGPLALLRAGGGGPSRQDLGVLKVPHVLNIRGLAVAAAGPVIVRDIFLAVAVEPTQIER